MYIYTAFLLLQATQTWVRHRVLLKVSVCVCACVCVCVCTRAPGYVLGVSVSMFTLSILVR